MTPTKEYIERLEAQERVAWKQLDDADKIIVPLRNQWLQIKQQLDLAKAAYEWNQKNGGKQ